MSNHLRRIEIDGFRGFTRMVIEDLGDVNIIVGKNSVGKTALLEALMLLGQPCLISNSTVMNQLRGLTLLANDAAETWGLIFNQQKEEHHIRIAASSDENLLHELTIKMGMILDMYPEREDKSSRPTAMNGLLQQNGIRFDYSKSDGTLAWAIATVIPGKLEVIDSSSLPDSIMIFNASLSHLFNNAADMYSDVVKTGLKETLINGIRSIVPELYDLNLLTRAGQPTLYATVDGTSLIPIQLLGEGVNRTIIWLLTILVSNDKIFLLDEIEYGIHHSVMENVFRALLQTAKERKVQIFATTHSYEALTALNAARLDLARNAPSMRIIRLQRSKGDLCVIQYDEEVWDAAVTGEMEIR